MLMSRCIWSSASVRAQDSGLQYCSYSYQVSLIWSGSEVLLSLSLRPRCMPSALVRVVPDIDARGCARAYPNRTSSSLKRRVDEQEFLRSISPPRSFPPEIPGLPSFRPRQTDLGLKSRSNGSLCSAPDLTWLCEQFAFSLSTCHDLDGRSTHPALEAIKWWWVNVWRRRLQHRMIQNATQVWRTVSFQQHAQPARFPHLWW